MLFYAVGEKGIRGTWASTSTESSPDEQRVPRTANGSRGTPRLGGDKVSAYITFPLHWTGDVSEVSAPSLARKMLAERSVGTRRKHPEDVHDVWAERKLSAHTSADAVTG